MSMLKETVPAADGAPAAEATVISASNPKSLLGNATWNLLSTVWFTAVSFLLTPFLITRLGTDRYGLFVLIMSVSGLLGIMDLGMGQATLRYVAYHYGLGDIRGINRTVGATFFTYIVTGLIAWAILYSGAPMIASWLALSSAEQELGASLLRLTAFNLGFMLIAGAFGAVPQALQRYDISTAMIVGQGVFQTIGMVAIVWSGLGVYELVLWSVITTGFRQIANVIIAKRLIPALRLTPFPSKTGLREVFGYGVFATATQMLGLAWREADRLLLGALVSPAAVAYLSVPKNLVFRGTDAATTAGAVLFPRFTAIEDLQVTRRLFLDSTWCLLCATTVLFVPITVLFPDFLRLWIGPDFARESAWLGQIIACSCIVRGAFVPYHGLFQGLGKPQYVTVFYLGSGLTNLSLNLVLIPTFGLAGAGYAYVVTLVWGAAALLFAWRWVLQADSFYPLVRAVLLPIALALSCLALAAILRSVINDPGWFGLLVLGGAFLVGTAVLVIGVEWLLGGHSSHAGTFLRAAYRLVQALPRTGAVMSDLGGRS